MTIEITGTVDSFGSPLAAGLAGHMPAGQREAVVRSFVADGSIEPGLALMQSSTNPADGVTPAAIPAADVDALSTTQQIGYASATTFSAFNGVLANKVFNPPRPVSISTATDADWDATTATVVGFGPGGVYQTDTIAIANGGGTTTSTTKAFERVLNIKIPAQSGACSGTIGLTAGAANQPVELAGFSRRTEALGMTFDGTTATSALPYATGAALAVVVEGQIYVESETDGVKGDYVFVRGVAAGAEKLGAVRTTPDGTDCMLAKGWRLATATAGTNKLCLIERV